MMAKIAKNSSGPLVLCPQATAMLRLSKKEKTIRIVQQLVQQLVARLHQKKEVKVYSLHK